MKKRYSEKRMYELAGDYLVGRMHEVLGKENTLQWFYSPLIALGNERPKDLCENGKQPDLEDILGRIEHGIYS